MVFVRNGSLDATPQRHGVLVLEIVLHGTEVLGVPMEVNEEVRESLAGTSRSILVE